MENEQSFFLQILSDHLNGRQTTQQENIDWSLIMTYAQNHQVNGIVYWQCKDFLPDEVGKRLRNKYFSELYYYYNREALFKQVKQAFSAAQIPFFTAKGLSVAQYYPIPALRTMGDCDIVVHTEDKEKASSVLISIGFENPSRGTNEWVYYKNKLEFELHDHLLYDVSGNTKSSRNLTDQVAWEKAASTGEGSCHELDWSFHFLFLLLHLKKHMLRYGIGFRQFMDLAVILQHRDLDWTWLQNTLKELELWDFLLISLALLRRWFEITSPVDTLEVDDAFYEEATEKVLGNGIFGFNDETNFANATISAILQNRGPLWWRRAKVLISSAFPTYRNMRYVPYYALLDRRPWLLPVAWIYRFYRVFRYHTTMNGKVMLDHAMTARMRLDAQKETLTKWGL